MKEYIYQLACLVCLFLWTTSGWRGVVQKQNTKHKTQNIRSSTSPYDRWWHCGGRQWNTLICCEHSRPSNDHPLVASPHQFLTLFFTSEHLYKRMHITVFPYPPQIQKFRVLLMPLHLHCTCRYCNLHYFLTHQFSKPARYPTKFIRINR